MEDVQVRLRRLYSFLSDEGWHVHANTVALALEEIGRLRADCDNDDQLRYMTETGQ
jgi:hypothetical protein